ncbi:hypothetical protein [Actinomadura madurae]|uniref:hypothetical protein n=1 Tax=Actinomadura madurae TaxID=1993 RepID=UPI0020D21175|nr:hypothetical protein [Actinomadura madurae]MCP9983034.1 hypothetical protein [Actinomadura madurae]MCQ0005411.1 hypothetical protein [Actinomadura madurae]MCQ0019275.1 hypothetical protein [Actinomadura madurae]
MSRDIDTMIGGLATVTDRQAADLLPDDAADALAGRITATAVVPERRRRRRSPVLLIGLPLATAGLACAAVAVIVRDDGTRRPPVGTTTASPRTALVAALSFTRKGDHIDVRVRDPLADPKRYQAEFAEHGLKVRLSLVPASPSIVGTVVAMSTSEGTTEDDIRTITAKGGCETGGGGDVCPVGVRIRTGYQGTADITFGRAARPGEQYSSSAPVTAPGEAMHGMTFRGHRVGEVLAALKKRNVTVPEYRVMDGNVSKKALPDQVPATWYVHDAVPWAKNQVLLLAGPEPTEPAGAPAAPPVSGKP